MPAEDYDDFARLTAQESHSIEGQIAAMELVEEMISRRQTERVRTVTEELRATGLRDEALHTAVTERVQPIAVHRMDLSEGIDRPGPEGKGVRKISRWNLVVEKGDGDEDDPQILRVMIPAHVDTVRSGARTELDLDMVHPDRLEGLGVYDMGAGVLNNIALATSVNVPKGMKVFFVFTVDEEENSIGARRLMERQLREWPMMDIVLSSEIGPVPPLANGDQRMRLITDRAGRLKMFGDISIAPGSQGHGAEASVANASEAMHDVIQRMKARMFEGFEDESAFSETHSRLPPERFEHGDVHAWREPGETTGYTNQNRANFDFSARIVPVSRKKKLAEVVGSGRVLPDDPLTQYEMFFERVMRGIGKRGQWEKYGLSGRLFRNPTRASYAPYEMPLDHPLVKIASATLERISGVAPDIVGAPSVADENDYAYDMLQRRRNRALQVGQPATSLTTFEGTNRGVITIPPNGDKAHNPDEWVSKLDIMRTRDAIRSLIEDATGFAQLLGKKQELGENF